MRRPRVRSRETAFLEAISGMACRRGIRADISKPRPRQTLGDEGRDVGLRETIEQQVAARRLDHGIDGWPRRMSPGRTVVDPRLVNLSAG